jgi:hypothetical protein
MHEVVREDFGRGRKTMKTRMLITGMLVMVMLGARHTLARGSGVAAFEQPKALVGHWETDKSKTNKATLDLELTSGGSVVIEKAHMLAQDKPVEMITLYYLDGDQLKLTHYCMAGNQPTMVGTYDPSTKTVKFDFVSATNLKSPNDGHMHNAVYTFIDSDHFKTSWTFEKDQKDAFTEEVTYVRVK